MPPGDDSVDVSLRAEWVEKQAGRGGGRPPQGPPGDGRDLVRRVGALEAAVDEIKADVKVLIRDVAEVKGRLSQMPTTFQMLTWFVGVALGLVGLVFAVARSLAPH